MRRRIPVQVQDQDEDEDEDEEDEKDEDWSAKGGATSNANKKREGGRCLHSRSQRRERYY
jgi:hypothetical protein